MFQIFVELAVILYETVNVVKILLIKVFRIQQELDGATIKWKLDRR